MEVVDFVYSQRPTMSGLLSAMTAAIPEVSSLDHCTFHSKILADVEDVENSGAEGVGEGAKGVVADDVESGCADSDDPDGLQRKVNSSLYHCPNCFTKPAQQSTSVPVLYGSCSCPVQASAFSWRDDGKQ